MVDIINAVKNELINSLKPIQGPSYILPDGSYVDIISSKINPLNFSTHGDIDYWLKDKGYIKGIKGNKLSILGCIRVNDGYNFFAESIIELPKKGINKNQLYSLYDYLEYLIQRKSFVNIGIYSKKYRDVLKYIELEDKSSINKAINIIRGLNEQLSKKDG